MRGMAASGSLSAGLPLNLTPHPDGSAAHRLPLGEKDEDYAAAFLLSRAIRRSRRQNRPRSGSG